MLRDDVNKGVSAALEALGFDVQVIEKISDAIISNALADPRGRELLTVDKDGEQIVHYHAVRGITAAAGVLGAGLTAVGAPITLPAVLASIGALGALHGLRTPLPEASARIVLELYSQQSKQMSKNALLQRFGQSYGGPQQNVKADFDAGLRALEQVHSIREEGGNVRLSELIVIRY